MRWLVAIFLACPAAAQDVVQVPYDPLASELSEIIDFESFPSQLSPGTNHDAPLLFEGAGIGERFQGQAVADADGYDRLAGPPSAPLSLRAGAPGRNLTITHIYFQSNQVQGLATAGYPSREAGGEGAIAVLFEQGQWGLGFRVSAEMRPDTPRPKGRMTVTFFARDGSLIDRLEVPLEWGRNGYGFRRAYRRADIAGIAIENRDPGGIAVDDIVFDLLRAGS